MLRESTGLRRVKVRKELEEGKAGGPRGGTSAVETGWPGATTEASLVPQKDPVGKQSMGLRLACIPGQGRAGQGGPSWAQGLGLLSLVEI